MPDQWRLLDDLRRRIACLRRVEMEKQARPRSVPKCIGNGGRNLNSSFNKS